MNRSTLCATSLLFATSLTLMVLVVAACSSDSETLSRSKIRHIVIIVQENRSFDNLFHGYPGADSASFGLTHDGTRVPLQPVSLAANYDLSNGYADFVRSYDRGRMDGYDMRRAFPVRGSGIPLRLAEYPAYAFVRAVDTRPYFDMASKYVLADHMFQSNIEQSFAAHLYLIAGQAGRSADVPDGRPWGCDAPRGTGVVTLRDNRSPAKSVFPCFDFKTIGDELEAAGRTWSYYAPRYVSAKTWQHFQAGGEEHLGDSGRPPFGSLWTAYDAIAHDRYGPQWSTNIVTPETKILTDVSRGKLADVTWVVPDWRNSDHALSRSDSGPSWVASVVNSIGKSRFWGSTVIFVLWDDSGGWYDHVPPPQLDYDGLGVRVPLLIISPYSRRGFVTHRQYEFGSLLKFIEVAYRLEPLAQSDRRAIAPFDGLNFTQPPRAFEPIRARRFELKQPSNRMPDDD